MKSYLKNFAKYNIWANELLIGLVQENIATIEATTKSSFPTIRATLEHILFAETLWLSRLKGEKVIAKPEYEGTNEALFEALLKSSKRLKDFIKKKNKAFVAKESNYTKMDGKTRQNEKNGAILLHVLNHSTYHRGQIVTMLRTLGATDMTSMDYITYLRKQAN